MCRRLAPASSLWSTLYQSCAFSGKVPLASRLLLLSPALLTGTEDGLGQFPRLVSEATPPRSGKGCTETQTQAPAHPAFLQAHPFPQDTYEPFQCHLTAPGWGLTVRCVAGGTGCILENDGHQCLADRCLPTPHRLCPLPTRPSWGPARCLAHKVGDIGRDDLEAVWVGARRYEAEVLSRLHGKDFRQWDFLAREGTVRTGQPGGPSLWLLCSVNKDDRPGLHGGQERSPSSAHISHKNSQLAEARAQDVQRPQKACCAITWDSPRHTVGTW